MRYVAGQKEQQWIYRWSLALPTGGSSLINTRAIREESGPISFTDEILAHCDTVQSFFGPSFPASSTREFKVSVSFPAVISERRLTFPNEPGPTHFPCEPRSFQVAVKRREEREREQCLQHLAGGPKDQCLQSGFPSLLSLFIPRRCE